MRKKCIDCSCYKFVKKNDRCAKCNQMRGLKECGRCHQILLLELEFYDSKRACKACINKYRKQNKASIQESQIKYREANKDRIRERQLMNRYGLTLEEYKNMYKTQNGACKICLIKTRLCIDHNHTTGKIRGLLCNNCNRCLGLLKEDTIILAKAIEYLNQ